jgi:hypothetical protein
MKVRKVIKRAVRRNEPGMNVASDVNAVLAANVNEPGSSHTEVSSKQRVVQRSTKDDQAEAGKGGMDERGEA